MTVELGEYRCSNKPVSGPNDENLCALYTNSDGSQALPPVTITVDFGDGSGEQVDDGYLQGIP